MPKITVQADVYSFNKGVEFVIAQTAKTGIDMVRLTKIKLMCQEILLMILRNAYIGTSGDIVISCGVKDNEFTIEIEDSGKAYNSLSGNKVNPSGISFPQTKVSDFGKLFDGACDSAEYRRVGHANVVTLKTSI
jgi:hypothetical protein